MSECKCNEEKLINLSNQVKTLINNNIKSNGVGSITGSKLNNVLIKMVDMVVDHHEYSEAAETFNVYYRVDGNLWKSETYNKTVSSVTLRDYTGSVVGKDFDGWSYTEGGSKISGTTIPCDGTNKTLYARLNVKTYTVSVNPYPLSFGTCNVRYGDSYGQSVSSVRHGDTVRISAVPLTGYVFDLWDETRVQDSETDVIVTSNISYTGVFVEADPGTTTVHIRPCGDGSVYGKVCFDENVPTIGNKTGQFDIDSSHYLRAVDFDASSCVFKGWYLDGVSVSSVKNVEFRVPETDITYDASFELKQYIIGTEATPEGWGSVSGGGTYGYGKTITLSADNSYGYKFKTWGDGVDTSVRSVTVGESKTYTAEFEKETYTVTGVPNVGSLGYVYGGGMYKYLDQCTLNAVPNPGRTFLRWNDYDTSSSKTFSVTGNSTYTAYFKVDTHTVSADASPSSCGSVSGQGTYDYGSSCTLTATPYEHYVFEKWSDNQTSNPLVFTVLEDVSKTAYFKIVEHAITGKADPVEGGTIYGLGRYGYGRNVTLKAVANSGYSFVKWNDDVSVYERQITVTGDADYVATFIQEADICTVMENGSGIWSYDPATGKWEDPSVNDLTIDEFVFGNPATQWVGLDERDIVLVNDSSTNVEGDHDSSLRSYYIAVEGDMVIQNIIKHSGGYVSPGTFKKKDFVHDSSNYLIYWSLDSGSTDDTYYTFDIKRQSN